MSIIIPKNPGSFDPKNEEENDNIVYVLAETYNSTIGEDDKIITVAEDGIE